MEEIFFIFIVVGFLAQVIDGAMGMAYGVSATAFLLAFGIPPSVASASVHAAEVVTTGMSGISHWRLGNVDRGLVARLILPGVLGAILGAYILSSVSGDAIKPYISIYLLLMGGYILWKMLRRPLEKKVRTYLFPLGLAGGFLDAVGGGGWGAIVVSNLLARGNHARFTIGSVNVVEFFVALSVSVTFVFTIGLSFWPAIVGLAVGGALAAPIAAYLVRHMSARTLTRMVSLIMIGVSTRALYQVFFS